MIKPIKIILIFFVFRKEKILEHKGEWVDIGNKRTFEIRVINRATGRTLYTSPAALYFVYFNYSLKYDTS